MAALYSFLDGAFADIRSKLELEYQERLAAHEKNISEELSPEDYTPDYGKINVVDALSHFYNEGHKVRPGEMAPPPCNPQILKWVGGPSLHVTQSTTPATDTHPEGRWFIHYIPTYTERSYQETGSGGFGSHYMRTTCSYSITLIDNYGLMYQASSDHTSGDKTQVKLWRLDINAVLSAPSSRAYKYKLPNFLIDFCKTLYNYPYDTTPAFARVGADNTNALQLLAEQYYKRFTAMKPLFTSGRFTDYESLLATKVSLDEKLATTNTQLSDATTQIATLTAEAERTKAELHSEIEQLKATMAAEAKKAADRERELRTQLETTNTERDIFYAELTDLRDTFYAELTDLRTSVSSLASETGTLDDPTVDAIRAKYTEMHGTLEETKAELAAAKAEIDRFRVSEENYVSQLFQQRQEITTYKKQLLTLNSVETSPAPAPLTIEELVAQAVKKALEKPVTSEVIEH